MNTYTILDTNVISETWKQHPDARVLDWFAEQWIEDLYVTSITVAELYLGVRLLPEGSKRTRLARAVKGFCARFVDRILVFDTAAALQYAACAAQQRARGRQIAVADGMIAGIALSLDATLVTRNVKDFEYTGVKLFNPWEQ